LDFAAKAAQFAKATNSSLADSVDLLSGAIQSFGLDASDTDRVASVFFTAIDKGRVTATELANTLGRVGPQAQAAGLSLEETAAAIASISVKGSKTSESLTQLRGIISSLIKPTPALRKELENLGFTESSSAIKTVGLAKTLDALSKSTAGTQQTLATLFPNVRAQNG
jgi:TP901 family phage tail tape measure protein